MKVHNRLTLGKVLICFGLFIRLLLVAFPMMGVKLFTSGTPGIIAVVVQVCLFAGGLVVYALEPRDNVQRIFAIVAAAASILTLISTDSAILPAILLSTQVVCLALITLTSRRTIRKIVGGIGLALAILISLIAFGYFIHNTALQVLIACATYVILGAGLFV